MTESKSVEQRRASPMRIIEAVMLTTATIALSACGGGQEARSGGDATSSPGAPIPSATGTTTRPATPPEPDFGEGLKLYATHCAMCHGPTGRGDGALGQSLNPPPRALVGEPWRYVEDGTPEKVKAGIVQLLKKGVPGSAMPPYEATLSEQQLEALADHVLSIRR